jgi:hypothetical protein
MGDYPRDFRLVLRRLFFTDALRPRYDILSEIEQGDPFDMKSLMFITALATLLSGCVRTVETRVNTSGGGAGMPSGTYIIAPAEKALSPELAQAQQLVSGHLAAKNFIPSQTGELYLQVTASARPAELMLATAKDGKPVILSAVNKKRPSSKCANNEYRVSVTLTRISSGAMAYHGTAAETHCKMAFAQVMPSLVDAALGDLHLPTGIAGREGSYVLKRKLEKPKN